MTKFNKKSAGSSVTVNHEGAKAYKLSDEMELYSAVVTASLDNKFYESNDHRVERVQNLIAKCNPEFVAKLAVYAREKMYLRTMPLVLAVELAKIHSGDNLVSKMTNRIVQRADELTEILAYYQKANPRKDKTKKLNKLSKQIQKGLALAFNKFNEYKFAKYDREGDVTLKDALFIVHPKPDNDVQQKLFDKIAKGTLKTPYTWEVELSKLGQEKYKTEDAKAKAFKKKWEELIDSGDVGYMALLRNLRNILEAKVSAKHIAKVCKVLADEEEVAKSKQLPFRFLSAYKEVKDLSSTHATEVLDAIEDAALASVTNIKGFNDKTPVMISCDVSGSMDTSLSEKSKVRYYEIGLVLGALAKAKMKSSFFSVFGDTMKVMPVSKRALLGSVSTMYRTADVGCSTNGYLVIQHLLENDIDVDKVLMFTDCQLWDSSEFGYHSISKEWKKYRATHPKANLYLFDLAGYGNTPLKIEKDGVRLIAGWSDKVFEVMDALEKGEEALSQVHSIVL